MVGTASLSNPSEGSSASSSRAQKAAPLITAEPEDAAKETNGNTTPKRALGRPKKSPDGNNSVDMEKHILMHAKALFRERGYMAVSITDIVEAAGTSKPTLYYYFKGKEDLYATVLVFMVQRGAGFICRNIRPNVNLRENLFHLARGYFEFCPTSMSAMMRDVSQLLSEEPAQRVYAAYDEHIIQPFCGLFDQAIAKNDIPARDTKVLAQIFVSLLDAMVMTMTSQYGRRFAFDDLAQAFIKIFMDGIVAPTDANLPV
jgi:AcrR family transcriptional regulator